MRKTKILCTLGPACSTVDIMKKMIESGMDAARINFSHSTHESATPYINNLKKAREELSKPIPMILDTKGPEIRIKTFKKKEVTLTQGTTFMLTTREVEGDETQVSVTHQHLAKDLNIGDRVLLDDGLVELKVRNLTETDIICDVINTGVLSARKGVNVPNVYVSLPSLTEQDVADIIFGVKMGFDYIAASFIRSESDVLKIRQVLEENGGSHVRIISKIESRDGLDNVERILDVSDGIMVARGDLGVELYPEEVPVAQKKLISVANAKNKPVITATHMLESMVKNPRPTRAEVNDVANAIYDGSDVIMLSGETASGKHPVESVVMMSRIAEAAEEDVDYYGDNTKRTSLLSAHITSTNAISLAAFSIARDLNAGCIVAVTSSGFSARMLSKYRPKCPILAITPIESVQRQLNLTWGCLPVCYNGKMDDENVFDVSVDIVEQTGVVKTGDAVVITVGLPLTGAVTTNTLKIQIMGNVFAKGQGMGDKILRGRANVFKSTDEFAMLSKEVVQGDIIVVTRTTDDMIPYIKKAAGIVVGSGQFDEKEFEHTKTVCAAIGIPAVCCSENVTELIPDSIEITVDSEHGFVYNGKKVGE